MLKQLVHHYETLNGGKAIPSVRRFHNFLIQNNNLNLKGGSIYPPNILTICVCHVGPWNILLIGEQHINLDWKKTKQLIDFLNKLINISDTELPSIDIFIEEMLPSNCKFLEGGQHLSLHTARRFFSSVKKENDQKIRLHNFDTRQRCLNYVPIKKTLMLGNKFYQNGLSAQNIQDTVNTLLEDNEDSAHIVKTMNLTQSVKFRANKEFQKIRLPDVIKTHIKMENLPIKMPSYDHLFYTDYYLFYRMLMTYSKHDESLPQFNEFSMVYGGNAHIMNILTWLLKLHIVMEPEQQFDFKLWTTKHGDVLPNDLFELVDMWKNNFKSRTSKYYHEVSNIDKGIN